MEEWAQQALDNLPLNDNDNDNDHDNDNDNDHDNDNHNEGDNDSKIEAEDNEIARRPFISYTRTQDGSSLVTEVRALLGMFPDDDLQRLDVQCATGELSSFDDSLYDDEEDGDEDDDEDDDESDSNQEGMNVDNDIRAPTPPTMPMFDMTQITSLIEGAPPTPPISTAGESSTSTHSSPTQKRLSLPFALSPPMLSPDLSTSTSEIQISWSSTRPTTRSTSKSFSTLGASALDTRIGVDGDGYGNGNGRGMKKCLQLDLRAISEHPNQSAYNLGMPILSHTSLILPSLLSVPST